MDARLETLLYRIRVDRVSGAAETARYVAIGLRDYLDGTRVEICSVREFSRGGFRVRRSMAPLFVLLNQVVTDLPETPQPDISVAIKHVNEFIAREDGADAKINKAFATIVTHGKVITISNSSTVARALIAVRRSLPKVVVMESRPGGEGTKMAKKLAHSGIECEVVADSMVFEVAKECGCAVCGADCVIPGYLVNKVGTSSLALAAAKAGIPLHALAASTKIVGVDISDPITRRRRRDGIVRHTQVFERTPLEGVTDLVTELGVLKPNELRFSTGPHPLLDSISRNVWRLTND
ncbi:MAG: hypothetical protein ABR879_02550 [Methanomassiliicoccales archaeon]|jgi:translation initiation factor 2B subunit (eIF-2B alpha/beta/delta family)